MHKFIIIISFLFTVNSFAQVHEEIGQTRAFPIAIKKKLQTYFNSSFTSERKVTSLNFRGMENTCRVSLSKFEIHYADGEIKEYDAIRWENNRLKVFFKEPKEIKEIFLLASTIVGCRLEEGRIIVEAQYEYDPTIKTKLARLFMPIRALKKEGQSLFASLDLTSNLKPQKSIELSLFRATKKLKLEVESVMVVYKDFSTQVFNHSDNPKIITSEQSLVLQLKASGESSVSNLRIKFKDSLTAEERRWSLAYLESAIWNE